MPLPPCDLRCNHGRARQRRSAATQGRSVVGDNGHWTTARRVPRVTRGRAALTAALLVAVGMATTVRAQDGGALGSVEGVVIDSKTGEPIIEAGIEVIGQ